MTVNDSTDVSESMQLPVIPEYGKAICRPLYEGSNATVYKFVRSPEAVVVVKVISRSTTDYELLAKREFFNAQRSHSTNIVSVLKLVCLEDASFAIIMPFYKHGDLHTVLLRLRKNRTDLPQGQKDYIFTQILRGIAHLHTLGIIHRDVKPGNCLISDAGSIQISDFGYSFDTTTEDFALLAKRLGTDFLCCGTPSFKGPELFEYEIEPPAELQVSSLFALDSWLLGIVYFHICCMQAPWLNAKDLLHYSTYASQYSLVLARLLLLRSINDKSSLLPRSSPLVLFRELPLDSRSHILKLLDPCFETRLLPAEILGSEWLKFAYASPRELLSLAKLL